MGMQKEKTAYFSQVKKGLNNFNSKIVSQVRASPAQIAKTLLNHQLRPQFKFGAVAEKDDSDIGSQIRKESNDGYMDDADLNFTFTTNNSIKVKK
jgi:hypothetical protein